MKKKLLSVMAVLAVSVSASFTAQADNLMTGWDANGSTTTTPYEAGWRSTDESVAWAVSDPINADTYQYRDNLSYKESDGGGAVGRVFIHPQNDALFSYPIVLEAGKAYTFSAKSAKMSGNATRPTTFAVNTAVDGTGTVLGADMTSAAKWDDFSSHSILFESPADGTYYLTWQTEASDGDRSLAWDFMVVEAAIDTEALSALIDQAESLYDASANEAGTFQAAIAAAREYLSGDYNQYQIVQATGTLEDAILKFRFANTYTDNPLDITSMIVNPDFEAIQGDKSQTISGWTKTGESNSEYCTRNDAGPLNGAFKTGNVYFQHWSSSNADFGISQTLTLPNGSYTLKVDAGGSEGTTGTFIYANEEEVEVTSTGEEYVLDIEVTEGELTIGFKSIDRTVNWAYADNFRLFYNGVERETGDKECQALAPELNLISDFEVSDLANFAGWGNREINTDLEYVYCGETSGKVWGTNGGSLDTKPIEMNENSAYRVRAQIYVAGEGQFQIGLLGGDDLIQTTKNDEWELIDFVFPTYSGTFTGLYFNCQNRGGTEGYIDNWEMYEWSADAYQIEALVKAIKNDKAYTNELEGAEDVKAAVEAAEAYLSTLTPDNVSSKAQESAEALVALQTVYRPFSLSHASPEYPADMTYAITNASFENNLDNWTNNGFQSQSNSSFGEFKEGNKYAEKWQGSGGLPDSDIHQIITDLPNGYYRLTVAAGFGDANGLGGFVYANDDEVEFGGRAHYSIITEVTEETLIVGVKLVDATSNHAAFDNFRLEYTNVSAEVYDAQQELIALVEEAKAITGVMQNAIADDLAEAIETAEAAIATPTLEALNEAKEALEEVLPAAKESAAAYAALNEAIEDSKAIGDIGLGYDVFLAAIEAAEEVYTTADADVETVNAATETLLDAGVDYAVANASEDTPADVTRWITNPNFEANQGDKQQDIPGWTKTGANDSEYCTRNDAGPLSGEFKTGNVYFQHWSSSNADFSISQEIRNLPQGDYTLYADAGGNDGTTGTFLYANDEEVEVTTTGSEYSIDLFVDQDTLVIGFKSISRTVNWAYADNFRLFFKGDNPDGVDNSNTIGTTAPFTAYVANNEVKVQFSLAASSQAEIAIYSLQGSLVATQNGSYAAGTNVITMDASILTTGVYVIQLTTGDQKLVQKLVK